MKDYISREAALTVLDWDCAIQDALNAIKAIPAADVAPVVRCGECKHWFDNGTDLCSCDRDALLRRRDFFCADGERKDGGQDDD